MAVPIDIIGKDFGNWHVDSLAYKKGYEKYYNCSCSCGTKKIVCGNNLRSGKSLSCGCYRANKTSERSFVDRTAIRYNKLVALRHEKRNGVIYWLCRCDCGNETWVRGGNLQSGAVKSCGCAGKHSNKVHGMSHTRLHRIWSKMIERCTNQHSDAYKYYGGEGKTVCTEWQGTDGFMRFYDWAMQNGYQEDLTIERININVGYEPSNCKWIPRNEQAWNTRNTKYVEFHNEKKALRKLVSEYNIPYYLVVNRLRIGWNIEEALGLKKHIRKNIK